MEEKEEIVESDNKKDGNVSVTIKDKNFSIKYSMSIRLKRNLDEKIIPDLQKKDKDAFLVIDGGEGKGKSTLGFQIGKYVDNSLDLSRVCFTAEDFREAVLKAKKGQCIVYDEAFTGLSSRSSLSMINKVLISLSMQMRQKNLLVIIILPTFFLLDKYIALFRARALIHVFESKGRRGYFRVYNNRNKKYLYLAGQKTYSYKHKYVNTNFKGRFYGKFALGDEKVEELYRKKKEQALKNSEKNPMTAGQAKYKEQRDIIVWRLRKELKMTYEQMANYLNEYDFDISFQQIRAICARFGDKEIKKDEKIEKIDDSELDLPETDEKEDEKVE